MPSDGMPLSHARCLWTERGFMLKVPSWRNVCVLYSFFCVLVLPDVGEGAKARCGRELIADLEFVCGDRGFYRGKPGGARSSGPRSRGKGIVEQCCIRGCDLQHLESYCAKPKRRRRQAPSSLQQTLEEQFWLVFQRRYQKFAEMNRDEEATSQKLIERTLYHWNSDDSVLSNSNTNTPNRPPSTNQHDSPLRVKPVPVFIHQNR
ncbi:insulin-like growth factor I [Myxocyprinus asiaticus]|uniref:insulin-like growth factor I n=1 Tax=Myxocyprinus asiaticus TaxID=70543 RepID=UPI00222275A1|nr:insulin-like growth factor I [Myxocyprinus asiaticus]